MVGRYFDGRFRKYTIDEIMAGDNTGLDIFQIKDKSLFDSDMFADDIIESLQTALDGFNELKATLNKQVMSCQIMKSADCYFD